MLNKQVMIIGGSGFLGSNVAKILHKNGYNIKIFDLKKNDNLKFSYEFIEGDIANYEMLLEATKKVDYIYHFAGVADIKEANEDPIKTVKYNVLGTTNILESCKINKVKRILFASSIYVYSESGGVYRSTKQAAELLIENYSKLNGLDYTILRYGSLYGPGANEFNSINKILNQAIQNKKIVRSGNGEEIREYIHINDAASGSLKALDEKFKNEYLILSGVTQIKIKDLLRMIQEMIDDNVEIEYTDEKLSEHYEITPYSFRPRIAKKLVQETHIDLGQGILDSIYDISKKQNK
tara:strand:- start:394 stop:1275 length:882 start_codon:yes stop_codon:yes gene_type:complete